MTGPTGPFTVAAVQASPVFLDRAATLEKACGLIAEAGTRGARLVVFPEAFLPSYPFWVWHIPAGHSGALRELYTLLVAESVTVPSPVTERLGAAARAAGVCLAIGVNERNAEASGTTLYNTLLYFDADGTLLGRHRKLVPTGGERLVHAQGDGSTLNVYDTRVGRLGGLICWENYMPLARYALYAWGVELWAAPTWDHGEPWHSTLRHIAKEGRVYVLGCCSPVRVADVPDHYTFKAKYLADAGEWINPGDSMIVDPDGKILAGPLREKEGMLLAEVDPARVQGPRSQLDVAGHYGRPDVFQLTVDRGTRPMVTATVRSGAGQPVEPSDE
jgi:nitrilase